MIIIAREISEIRSLALKFKIDNALPLTEGEKYEILADSMFVKRTLDKMMRISGLRFRFAQRRLPFPLGQKETAHRLMRQQKEINSLLRKDIKNLNVYLNDDNLAKILYLETDGAVIHAMGYATYFNSLSVKVGFRDIVAMLQKPKTTFQSGTQKDHGSDTSLQNRLDTSDIAYAHVKLLSNLASSINKKRKR